MSSEIHRTLIVGAGHGGSQCAISLRAANYTGEILLVDADKAALPYHKPPLSKKYLLSMEQTAVPLRPATAYDKADVQRISDTLLSIDTHKKNVKLQDGGDLSYDKMVLATGANNRELEPLIGVSNVHSIRTLQDSQTLRDQFVGIEHIHILGGGFIGLEIAACLASMGKSVTVIEAGERVLGRVVSPEISMRIEAMLEQVGVTLIIGQQANHFAVENNEINSINFTGGESLAVELLIVGIGAIANTSVASEAGIACDNGILVNESLQTSSDDVYAIGDCARYPHWQTQELQRLESVQNAVDQAKLVATQIAERKQLTYQAIPWFWSDIGPLKLQIAGIYTGDTERVIRAEDDKLALYHLQDNRIVCVETINSAKDHLVARKLIGSGISVSENHIQEGPEALKALLDAG